MPRVGALIVWLPAILFGQAPKTFDSTEPAAQALTAAAEKDDVAAFRIFGPVGKAVLTSGDPKQDKSFEIRAARPQEPRNEGRDVMAATLQALEVQLEDPLAHLPCSMILEYGKGQIIYSPEELSTSFYLVIDGKVKVCRMSASGRQVVVDIYRTDEFFGETAFLDSHLRDEQAVALEDTKLMSWTTSEIQDIATRRPRLTIALLQILAQRTIDFGHRIESFSADTIARRLARALVRFSERMGQRNAENGPVQMMPITHELLSQYVGTSREIITLYMNQFRREGYLDYSRKKGILVYGDALRDWLRQQAA